MPIVRRLIGLIIVLAVVALGIGLTPPGSPASGSGVLEFDYWVKEGKVFRFRLRQGEPSRYTCSYMQVKSEGNVDPAAAHDMIERALVATQRSRPREGLGGKPHMFVRVRNGPDGRLGQSFLDPESKEDMPLISDLMRGTVLGEELKTMPERTRAEQSREAKTPAEAGAASTRRE